MTVQVIVYSDYVCPYCLLAENTIKEAVRGKDTTIVHRPFELRPHPIPTLRPEDDYLPRVWRDSVYPMAERLGVPISLPPISPQPRTHTAFEGLCHATDHGKADAYTEAMFRAFFQHHQDIGDIDTLTAIAATVGLDPTDYRTSLLDGRYRYRHQQALRQATHDGVTAVPTIRVGPHRTTGVPDPTLLNHYVDNAIATA